MAVTGRLGASGDVLATEIASEFVRLINAVVVGSSSHRLRANVMDAEAIALAGDQFESAKIREDGEKAKVRRLISTV